MERKFILNDFDEVANKKRKAILSKIENMDDADIQLLYQTIFKDDIIAAFDNLPLPKYKPTDAEIDAVITQKRKQNGFYK